MVTLEIRPSFHPPSTFLLEQTANTWHLKVTKRSYTSDDAHKWTTTVDNDRAREIAVIATAIVEMSKHDYRIILDGVGLTCAVQKDGKLTSYDFRCPEPESDELRLVVAMVNVAMKGIKEHEFIDYLKSIETYFDITRNIKITSTPPYTVRLYGSLSRNEKANVCRAINDASGQSPVVIDLTKLEDMSTLLFDCFFPLASMKDVTIVTTAAAMESFYWRALNKYLLEIGFDLANIEVVE